MRIKHLLSIAFIAIPLMASAQITIDETNFPDENFRNYLLEQDYGQDGVITDEEIQSVFEISVREKSITSLKGIEFFTELIFLDCYRNELTSLDVSNNIALNSLICISNKLTSLDVSNNTALTTLQLTSNNVRYIDVSKNTALIELWCNDNGLTTLDISKNTALVSLRCDYNALTSLDISNNTALMYLMCHINQLSSLDLSKNTELCFLRCEENALTSLDVSNNTKLTSLFCYQNQIKGITMDALIESLPSNEDEKYLYIFNNGDEGNICTKDQIATIKEKGWIPCYNNGKEYSGSTAPTTISVSLPKNALIAYCPAFDVRFGQSTRYEAYKASYSDGTVLLEKIESAVAGEGILLRSLSSRNTTVSLPIREAEKNEGNALVGTLNAAVLPETDGNVTNFVLSTSDDGVSYFRKADNTPIAAWEAYLPIENYNGTETISIVFDDETGIGDIKILPSADDDAFYTLSGVRVTTPTKGIYIKNGKKVYINQ